MPGIPIPSPCALDHLELGTTVTGTEAEEGARGGRLSLAPQPLALADFSCAYVIVDSTHWVIKCRVIQWRPAETPSQPSRCPQAGREKYTLNE